MHSIIQVPLCTAIAILMVGLMTTAGSSAAMDEVHHPSTEKSLKAHAAFDRLKTLKGTWQLVGDEKKTEIQFDVVSDGTAVIEYHFGMVTVYHLDGDGIRMTHYCSVGNQPRMLARPESDSAATFVFELTDVGNLPAAGPSYMKKLTLDLSEHDRLTEDWTWTDGQKSQQFRFVMKRIKK